MVPWKTFSWKCCTAGFQPPPPFFLFAHVSAELVPWSTVPTPLKCGWSRAVWISSHGGACAGVRLILSLWKSWIYFWLFSVAWTGNETAYWPWRFIWTSLVIVEGFWDREKDFFFLISFPGVTTYAETFPHGILFDVWVADTTRISAPDTFHFSVDVFVLIHAGNLWAIYEPPPGNFFLFMEEGAFVFTLPTMQYSLLPTLTLLYR